MDRFLGGVDGSVVAGAVAQRHERVSAAAHDLLDVVEVEVDLAGDGEHVGDAAHGLAEDVVGAVEGLGDREAAVVLVDQALVGDHDYGVGDIVEPVDAFLGGTGAGHAFELEGSGDDGDGQGTGLTGHLGDDRGGAGAGAAAHAGGDEGHIDIGEEVADFVAAVLGRARAAFGVAADAETVGFGVGDADDGLGFGAGELLVVGVDGDELDAANFIGDHAVDGVATAAADSNNGDRRDALAAAVAGSSGHLRVPLVCPSWWCLSVAGWRASSSGWTTGPMVR